MTKETSQILIMALLILNVWLAIDVRLLYKASPYKSWSSTLTLLGSVGVMVYAAASVLG